MDTTVATDNQIATSILCYEGFVPFAATPLTAMPSRNATKLTSFMDSLRSLDSKTYPTKVPLKIDHSDSDPRQLVYSNGEPSNTFARGGERHRKLQS